MDAQISTQERYDRARKRVKKLKCFYGHLQAYLIVNLVLIAARYLIPQFVDIPDLGPDGWTWVDVNVWGTTAVWGIALAIHALVVFRDTSTVFRQWEERKIREIMKEEEMSARDRWS